MAQASLPTGTVTFLFSDIEGSTVLLRELGDRYADLLSQHHRLLRDVWSRHGGVEMDTQGDAFSVVFARASAAVAAAAAAQDALAPTGLRVRMGVHTGEPTLTETGYVGMDVHRAARIAAVAHGGQVLVSQSTRDLLDTELELRDLGEHRLKDLARPERLHQLGSGSFPPLRSLTQTNLPVLLTPLVGREREVEDVVGLMRTSRLLTLTGPGGTGKTRLSLQAAAELGDEFPNGVWWVPLSPISEPAFVATAVAQALGVVEGTGRTLDEALGSFLADKQLLLVLDNFEHLLNGAPTVADLLAGAPQLRALVTSRARLALSGEQEYPVPPLVDDEAAELFDTRARALRPDFAANGAVGEICRRLDGLPLAIELAAARVKVLTPQQILERLEHRLEFLTGGARDVPERQRTLRATIEWSYELLDERERLLFARLAVFAGTFDLEAAERVCECDLDTLASLVDKSLLRQTADGRFFMLDTIGEFAQECLRALDEERTLRDGHAAYFAALAETARPCVKGPEHLEWLRRLDAEHSNIRAALRHFIDVGAGDSALCMCFALKEAWDARARYTEARRWLSEAKATARDDRARAWGDSALGLFAFRQGDLAEALELEQGVAEIFERYRMLAEQAEAISNTGFIQMVLGRTDEAVALGERATTLARESGDAWMISWTLNAVACAYYEAGGRELAWELMRESARIAREVGDRRLLVPPISNLGEQATAEGKLDEALSFTREAIELAREVGDIGFLSNGLLNIGMIDLLRGDVSELAEVAEEAIDLALEHGILPPLLEWLFVAAAAFAVVGQGERAVTLWAAGQANLVGTFDHLSPIIRTARERFLEPLREQLDADSFDDAWQRGRALTYQDAARDARQIRNVI